MASRSGHVIYSNSTNHKGRIATVSNRVQNQEIQDDDKPNSPVGFQNVPNWSRKVFPDVDHQHRKRDDMTKASTPSLISGITTPPGTPNSLVFIETNNNLINKNRFNPSFYHHLIKLERWAYLIGINLLAKNFQLDSKGRWKADGHYWFYIYFWRFFLFSYILSNFVSGIVVKPDNIQMMLYIGDFSNIYGVYVDRFAFNAFKFCWGLHAFIIYWWITRANGKIRNWLSRFEKRYLETAFYVNKSLEVESLQKMRNGRRFLTLFIQLTTITATLTITLLNIYGYFVRSRHHYLDGFESIIIYIAWSVVHLIWFWATFVINLTAFGHHFLLCRAIHIRFDETKKDLEYAILGEFSIHTKPEQISGLITKHYYVCDMVKQANKHLKVYLFIFYMIFAPHLCLMIYQIIFSSNFTAQSRILMGFLLILSDFFQVYSVSVLSAQITTKSHEPYYAMHGVNKFENLPENIQLQSTLFMQRISNTVVGLTILDSFVLTGGLISSLVTVIVTYFSVIMESS